MKTYIYTINGSKCIWAGNLTAIPRTGELISLKNKEGKKKTELVKIVTHVVDNNSVILHIDMYDFDNEYEEKLLF